MVKIYGLDIQMLWQRLNSFETLMKLYLKPVILGHGPYSSV